MNLRRRCQSTALLLARLLIYAYNTISPFKNDLGLLRNKCIIIQEKNSMNLHTKDFLNYLHELREKKYVFQKIIVHNELLQTVKTSSY